MPVEETKGYLEVEVIAPPSVAAVSPQPEPAMIQHPSLPGNLQTVEQSGISRTLFIFTIGFMVIFAGIYMAKRLKVISGTLITKQDRKLIEKAKRALGFASHTYFGPGDPDQGP